MSKWSMWFNSFLHSTKDPVCWRNGPHKYFFSNKNISSFEVSRLLRQIRQYKLFLLLFSRVRRVWQLACFQLFPQAVGWWSCGKLKKKAKQACFCTLSHPHDSVWNNWRVANQTSVFHGVQSNLQSTQNYRRSNKRLEVEFFVKSDKNPKFFLCL